MRLRAGRSMTLRIRLPGREVLLNRLLLRRGSATAGSGRIGLAVAAARQDDRGGGKEEAPGGCPKSCGLCLHGNRAFDAPISGTDMDASRRVEIS